MCKLTSFVRYPRLSASSAELFFQFFNLLTAHEERAIRITTENGTRSVPATLIRHLGVMFRRGPIPAQRDGCRLLNADWRLGWSVALPTWKPMLAASATRKMQ